MNCFDTFKIGLKLQDGFVLRPAPKRRALWPALQAKQIDAGVGHRGCFREKGPDLSLMFVVAEVGRSVTIAEEKS